MKAAVVLCMLLVTALGLGAVSVSAAPIIRAGVTTAGAADPAFNAVINAFRSDLGGVLNPPGPCTPPCTSGRREINWDGVPDALSSPNAFPGNFFNGTTGVEPNGRIRGLSTTTPGTGFQVSADATPDPAGTLPDFGNIQAFGPAQFAAFSPQRLFTSLGSNITDVTFSVPGDPTTSAFTKGFGVVFTDVDFTGSASMEFFSGAASLGKFDVPGVFPVPTAGVDSLESFSFLGVSFDAGEKVTRVRIISGTGPLDGTFTGLDDAVVMDDFIYGEPRADVPAPAAGALFALGLAAATARRRGSRR